MDNNGLRVDIRAGRRALAADERLELSDIITDRLCSLTEYKHADIMLVYADSDGEVATDRLIARALLDGKEVYAPVCGPEYSLGFYRIFAIDELYPGSYGIREPLKIEYLKLDSKRITKDTICITPGLVFDRKGHRLGYGKGYYDRFFAENHIVHRIAPVYDFQLTEEVPEVSATDISMTIIVSDKDIIRIS